MFGLPWWATFIINLIAKALGDWDTRAREAQANRDLGAAAQREASNTEAVKQETKAAEAAAKAQDGPDDPRDLRD